MPQMGVSVAEGTVVAWRVEVGDPIKADATIVEISTDKIDTEVPAPASGVVSEILVPVESTVSVGTVLARIATGASAPQPLDGEPAGPTRPETPIKITRPGNGHRRYSPVVQRIAAEHGVDLEQVSGTGRGGRVRKQDVLAFMESAPVEEPPLQIESPYRPAPGAPPMSDGLSRMRRQIGQHMKRSLEVTATCTTWIEVDMSRVE